MLSKAVCSSERSESADWVALLARAGGWSGGCKGMVQSLVVGQRVPVRMMVFWYQTVALSLSKVTMQSASTSWATLMRLVSFNAGMMCASRAERGRCLMLMKAVWVDLMVDPSGWDTVMPLAVGCLSLQLAWGQRKWPVVPESSMAGVVGGEESSVGVLIDSSLLAL